MKRSLLLLTAAAVAVTPLAASAAPVKTTKRTVTFDYTGFSSVDTPAASLQAAGVCVAVDSCMEFPTNKGEKTIEVTGSDPSVGIQVWYDDAYADNVVTFCGKGKITVSPKAAHVIAVRPSLGGCGGTPSTGTLTAVITVTK